MAIRPSVVNTAQLVDKYINTAYDKVVSVADNIDSVVAISDTFTSNPTLPDSLDTVAENVADITNFNDVYQGAKTTDPTLRNDGSVLQSGDLYFNTSINALRAYSGSVWVSGTAGTMDIARFSGDGSDTTFTLPIAPASENNTQVYLNGVYQQKDTYSVSGTTLTFSEAPIIGTNNIEIVIISTTSIGETDASLVSYTPPGIGAVTRNAENEFDNLPVTPERFGAIGDNVTDDYAALVLAFNYWKANGGVLVLTQTYKTTQNIIVDFSTNSTRKKAIYGFGASINGASIASGSVLTFTVSGASTLVRDIHIIGLTVNGSASVAGSAMVMQGPLSSSSYFYGCSISKCTFNGYMGLSLLGNFFESKIEGNNIEASASGYGIYVDTAGGSGAGSGGVISSINLAHNNTRGGINGVRVTATSSDVNIDGGTYLLAQQEGIRVHNALGGYCKGAHVEASWQSNKVATSGQAGIYVTVSGTYAIENTYSVNNYGHAARVYVGAGACAFLVSGFNITNTLQEFYLWGAAGSAAILNGSGTYTSPGAISITRNTGVRALPAIKSSIVTRLASPSSVTPSIAANTYHILLTSNPTINAPSFTAQYGDEIEFSFEQAGGGGNTVTWDAVYRYGAFVPTTTYGKTSSIRFKYLETAVAGAKWMIVSSETN